MIFGNPERFAIDAFVEDHLVPRSAAWGRMCVWCSGEMLGDLDEPHCGLEAASSFELLADSLDSLWDESLIGLGPREMFDFLDRALFLDSGQSLDVIRRNAERYSEFEFLTNWGEPFNGFKGFVIARPDAALLILFQRPDDSFGFAEVEMLEFRIAAKSVSEWYDQETKRLSGK